MERTITSEEAAAVRWLLEHAPVGDVMAYRALPVEELRVYQGCGCRCGCSSLNFQPDGWRAGAGIIADAWAEYTDGQQAGLILWERDGEIALLEVYDRHPGASHRVPRVANLRSFDEPAQGLP